MATAGVAAVHLSWHGDCRLGKQDGTSWSCAAVVKCCLAVRSRVCSVVAQQHGAALAWVYLSVWIPLPLPPCPAARCYPAHADQALMMSSDLHPYHLAPPCTHTHTHLHSTQGGPQGGHRAGALRPALLPHRGRQDLPARLWRPVPGLWQGRAGLPLRLRGRPHGACHAAHAVWAGHEAQHPVLW